MLNHIIKDEESKLEALLLGASEASRDDLVAEALDEGTNEVLVSLEQGAHKLSGSDLQVELVGVLLLDKSQIVSVKHIILILNLLLIGERVVLSDTLKRLGDDVNGLISDMSCLSVGHESFTSLIDHILESLNLSDERVRIQLLLHSGIKVGVVLLGHLVEGGRIHVPGLGSLHKARQRTGTSAANAVVGLVAGLSHE